MSSNSGHARNLFQHVLQTSSEPFDPARLRQIEAHLAQLPLPDHGSRAYLDRHTPRLARTIALVPPPRSTGRILELGCYMQITPFLQRLCHYEEVRGAYYGAPGQVQRKTIGFPDGDFTCDIDLFDAELDPYPFSDGYFDTVVAGEIIEHFLHDPMHMLLESHRVLAEGGTLLITTPNVGSITSVAKTLSGNNPQIYSSYKLAEPGEPLEIGHMREYTVKELSEIVQGAGFDIESIFTTFLPEYESHRILLPWLEMNGYSTEHRGQQIWCLATKREGRPVTRYPAFLYE
jgi:SAM-dependent methyltransferase